MAMLATLEGIEQNRGGIFGACLGACEMVASTVRGCLGASAQQNWQPGFDAITDATEKILAQQEPYFLGLKQPSSIVETGIAKGQSVNLDKYGSWFYPVQIYKKLFKRKAHDYPELTDEEISTLVYYEIIAANPKPQDYEKAVMYDKKINTLREFINGKGWFGGIRKTESAQSQRAQAAAAAASASAAAQAYKKAMEQRAIEKASIEQQKQQEAKETLKLINDGEGDGGKTETGTGSSILPILGIAAAAALAFMG